MCDWCGRPLLLAQHKGGSHGLWVLVSVLSVLAVGFVLLLALLNAPRLAARNGSPAPTLTVAPAVVEEEAVPPPEAAASPEEPTGTPSEYVRVTNTGGQGVVLRREPNTGAARVTARAENVVLRVVGPDGVSGGRVWREVEDNQGNRGWVPADFLAPAPPPAR